jgi:hypothetical protein
MKPTLLAVLLSSLALGQTSEHMITFDRANTEHCKVELVGGKPLLESNYEGTTVAIGSPINRGNGEFAIFVVISRDGPGTIQINPNDFYGVFSDPSHTRFTFSDEAAHLPTMGGSQPPYLENVSGNGQTGAQALARTIADPPRGMRRPGGPTGPNGPPPISPTPPVYFRRGKIKQGGKIFGWIALRLPKGSEAELHPADMLDEINIPVNGTVYRF